MLLPPMFLRLAIFLRLVPAPELGFEVVDERPDHLRDGVIYHEVRGGYPKWAHLACPLCGEHIQVPLAGAKRWTLKRDMLGRPSMKPSIWQTGSCQAHFFIRHGRIDWV